MIFSQPRSGDFALVALVALVAPAFAVGVAGCGAAATSSSPGNVPRTDATDATDGASYCEPPRASSDTWTEDPLPAEGHVRSDPRRRIRAALGLDGLSASLSDERDRRLAILARIEAARLSIDRISAELDCEGERANQVGNYLDEKAQSWVQSFTVASLVTGAATGAASAILMAVDASKGSQLAIGLSGAAATGALGVGALVVHPRLRFVHARNLLADIWAGTAASAIYPPLVWAYLSRPEFSNRGDQPIRAKIAARWRSFGELQPEDATLLFGRGGAYDERALHMRATMLNQVKAEVELLNQELASAFAP